MPLSNKGKKILKNMKKTYSGQPGKAEQVFYASANKGTISGVEKKAPKKKKGK
jgi:hypothetical protein